DYRLHHQTGVDFSARSITQDALEQSFATADSDLQQFFAHQVGAKAVIYFRPPRSGGGPSQAIDLGFSRYWRSNSLRMNIFSIGFAQDF
ncbi:MAG: hypothetical protein IAG13_37040, partial [Deltaproteobacteria bacterium]|nr:hypothetical protein [Nannocystaceae bacterium]